MANLGITVNELLVACLEQVKKGNRDKHIIISSDDEGNSFHTLFYLFVDDKDEVELYLEIEHDETHTADNCVVLG